MECELCNVGQVSQLSQARLKVIIENESPRVALEESGTTMEVVYNAWRGREKRTCEQNYLAIIAEEARRHLAGLEPPPADMNELVEKMMGEEREWVGHLLSGNFEASKYAELQRNLDGLHKKQTARLDRRLWDGLTTATETSVKGLRLAAQTRERMYRLIKPETWDPQEWDLGLKKAWYAVDHAQLTDEQGEVSEIKLANWDGRGRVEISFKAEAVSVILHAISTTLQDKGMAQEPAPTQGAVQAQPTAPPQWKLAKPLQGARLEQAYRQRAVKQSQRHPLQKLGELLPLGEALLNRCAAPQPGQPGPETPSQPHKARVKIREKVPGLFPGHGGGKDRPRVLGR